MYSQETLNLLYPSAGKWFIYVHNAKNSYEPEYPGINKFPAYSYPLGIRQHFSQAIEVIVGIYEDANPGEEVVYTIVER